MKTFIWIVGWVVVLAAPLAAQINVMRYDIRLDVPDLKARQLSGRTDVHFRRHGTWPQLALTLQGYDIEQVRLGGQPVKYERRDSLLLIPLPPPADFNAPFDTHTVRIDYRGTPADPSWFGGVYFADSFAYNLGVHIEGPAHSHGKAWFPCVDEFVDKARFRFWITPPKGLAAVCNGSLQGRERLLDGRERWHWTLRDDAPPYLASFAIGPYTEVRDEWKSQHSGTVPISLWVPPALAEKARLSFARLKGTLTGFEQHFGPYRWERVGYVGVPMKGGAMEHATNIAYPLSAIDGTDRMERLWAHELAHSWFGNLVTTSTPSEMWLNEGFARWAEALHTEIHFGPEAYRTVMRGIQAKVLEYAASRDGGYYPVASVPSNITYGSTVYDKGALVVHSLRSWLGDAVFFETLRMYLSNFAFDVANNMLFVNTIQQASGLPAEVFFNTWIRTPGYVHFACDSLGVRERVEGGWRATLAIRQRLWQSSMPAFDVRVPVWVVGSTADQLHRAEVNPSGSGMDEDIDVPFEPKGVLLDPEEHYTDASIDRLLRVTAGDTATDEKFGRYRFRLVEANGPRLLQLRAHYIQSDLTRLLPIRQVAHRYWSIDGYLAPTDRYEYFFMVDLADCFEAGIRNELERESAQLETVLYFRPRTGGRWTPVFRQPGFQPGAKLIFPQMQGRQAGDYAIGVVRK